MDEEIKLMLQERERLLTECGLFLYQFEKGKIDIDAK